MPAICGVCNEKESKYRCPRCEIRFCSVLCNKIHKITHENVASAASDSIPPSEPQQGSEQTERSTDKQNCNHKKTQQSKFDGFEDDAEFKRLIARYPNLKYELQLIYGVTMEPGPDEAYTWGKQNWFDDGSVSQKPKGFKNRGGRGREGGVRGANQGGRGNVPYELPIEERQHGPWTQLKGDKQALDLIRKLREVNHGELSEGMCEFIKLCAIRFGQ